MQILNLLTTSRARLAWYATLALVILGSIIPKAGPPDMGFGFDKVVHFVAYFFLAMYPAAVMRPFQKALLIAVSMAPLGFLLEYMQKFVGGRSFSPEDMIANNLGSIAGIALGLGIRFLLRQREARK